VASKKPLVFISYETSEALQYATEAKRVFESRDYDTWVWHLDRSVRGYDLDDIMDAIEACDIFLHICTANSDASRGQDFERRYAWQSGKEPPVLLVFDKAYISRMHRTGAIYNSVTNEDFTEVCSDVAVKLGRQPQVGVRIDDSDQIGTRIATGKDEPREPA